MEKKTIWITGASDGIGKALVQVLAKEGHHIILSARNEEMMQIIVADLGIDATSYLILPFDLGQLEEVEAKVKQVVAKFGRIDILINNAGLNQKSEAILTQNEVERQIMEVNFFGTIALSKAVAQQMQKQNGGKIVVINSIIGRFGNPFLSTYSASKHALFGYFESMRYEVEKFGIQIQFISPGFIQTSIAKKAITGDGSAFGQDSKAQQYGMPVEKCANKIVKIIKSNRKHTYIGGLELLFPRIKFFLPNIFYFLIKKLHKL